MTVLRRSGAPSLVRSLTRLLKASTLTLTAFLLQTCVAPYLKVGGVMPNFLMVTIAVLTVSCGKKYAFAAGAAMGIMLESMSSSIPLLYALSYPSLALLFAQPFADMNDYRREMRRMRAAQHRTQPREITSKRRSALRKLLSLWQRRSPEDLEPHLRIALNALSLTLAYEIIMLVYIALDGVPISWNHFARVLIALLLTLLGSVLMFPARWVLGIYAAKRRMSDFLQAVGTESSPDSRTFSGLFPRRKSSKKGVSPLKPETDGGTTQVPKDSDVAEDPKGGRSDED